MKLTDFVLLLAIFGSHTGYSLINDDCRSPPIFENARPLLPSNAESYPDGTVINYQCEIGYVGRLQYMCKDGEWKNKNRRLVCRLKYCESPGDTAHGTFQLVKGDDLVFGARIEYTCDEGYQIVGTRNYRICEATGWSGQVPHCEVKTCASVNEPENGKIVLSGVFDLDQDFPFGSVLQFECNSPELEIQGAKEIYCLANKTWSAPVPKCKELECKKPKITYGQVLSREKVFKYFQKLHYKCNRNYKPASIQQTVCTKFGWNPPPTCSPITCTITPLEHGKFLTTKWIYGHKDEVEYTCDENYKPLRSSTVQCQALGWTPNPSCIAITCNRPGISTYFYPHLWSYRLMEEIIYDCENSRQQSRCTADGWAPPIKCSGPCQSPPQILNGYFEDLRSSYPDGVKVRYSCNRYFVLQGVNEIQCTDGEWFIKGSYPFCIERGCDKPSALRNGRFHPDRERYRVRDRLTYSCDDGYELHGKREVYCGSKSWFEAPICIDPKLECPAPPEIGNTIITSDDNRSIRYRCQNGYQMEGSDEVICINGNWSQAPVCHLPPDPTQTCNRPPPVQNGDTTSIYRYEYRHGDKVTYQCQNYYVLEGSSEVKCSGGKWSTPPRCIAPCIVTKEDFRNNGIFLKWSFQTKIDVQHGDRLEFTCPQGFHIEPPAIRYCNNGNLDIPKCLNDERKLCNALQYSECPSCASSEICVQYHVQKISTSKPDPSTLKLVATHGTGNASFTVQNIGERNSNILKFSIKESNNSVVNIRFSNELRSIQYENPATGDYCITFPTDNSIIFKVTFSETFIIRFDGIKENLG